MTNSLSTTEIGEPSGKPESYYASPSSGEAYRDRLLTTNFEL